jgi:DHA1 family tetracycline resistance protein-like MFS transporter
LQGALSSLRGLAMIFGPGIFSTTFAACIAPGRWFPAGPWYLAAVILLIALALAWNVTAGRAATGSAQMAQEGVPG